jgi:hypothetical protein
MQSSSSSSYNFITQLLLIPELILLLHILRLPKPVLTCRYFLHICHQVRRNYCLASSCSQSHYFPSCFPHFFYEVKSYYNFIKLHPVCVYVGFEVLAAVAKGPHARTSLGRESGSASLTREPGSDIFHHTRMSGLPTLLVLFSIQNEFIEASCSSGDNTR